MRILMLTPQLPYPPRQGTALRNWGILSGLAQQHEVWLLSFDEQGGDVAPELRASCRQVAAFPVPRRSTAHRLRTLLTSTLPDMAWRLWSPAFASCYEEWVSQQHFDIIQVEGIELARYPLQSKTKTLKIAHPKTAPEIVAAPRIIFDDHNCEYLFQRRAFEVDARQPRRWHAAAYSFVQWQRLRAFERRAARSAHATLCVSPQDAALLAGLHPSIHPHTIYNGIDVARYASFAQPGAQATRAQPPARNSTLVFTGKMDFRPNIDAMLWFCREVLPLIKQTAPQTRLLIVGQRPSTRLDVLRADPSITLTGAVDDVRPYIAEADVYVAPLRAGGGTRFKLLEAMSMRRAIVSTTLGCEGFDVASGQELIVGDSPAAFAGAVVRLLGDPAARTAMGERAHAFVSVSYDWRVIVPKLERVYKELLNLDEAKGDNGK